MTDLPPPFVVFTLPRSRSYWCSRFLSYAGWQVTHEEMLRLRSLDDLRAWLAMPFAGTVETAAAPFWRTLRELRPDARIATIRRDAEASLDSLCRATPGIDVALTRRIIRHIDAKLDTIEARCPDVCRIDFADLATEAACARLFEHCLPFQQDPVWWQAYDALNLQCNLPALYRYYQAYAPQLAKLTAQVKHRTIAAMARQPVTDEAVTFQPEPFSWAIMREAIPLAKEHCVQTGQAPDSYLDRDFGIYEKLASLGALQIMTARCNGRMFGYLVSIIAPSIEMRGQAEAFHSAFFADAGIKGLGMKLQRAAIAALRARGVDELFMRTGLRGDGPRLGAVYRRLGATEFAQLYRLGLKEAA